MLIDPKIGDYVKCIDTDSTTSITINQIYQVMHVHYTYQMIQIVSDNGTKHNYGFYRFDHHSDAVTSETSKISPTISQKEIDYFQITKDVCRGF